VKGRNKRRGSVFVESDGDLVQRENKRGFRGEIETSREMSAALFYLRVENARDLSDK